MVSAEYSRQIVDYKAYCCLIQQIKKTIHHFVCLSLGRQWYRHMLPLLYISSTGLKHKTTTTYAPPVQINPLHYHSLSTPNTPSTTPPQLSPPSTLTPPHPIYLMLQGAVLSFSLFPDHNKVEVAVAGVETGKTFHAYNVCKQIQGPSVK